MVNIQKKRQVQWNGIAYNGQSVCILNLEDIEKSRQLAENKEKDKIAKRLAQKDKQDSEYFLQVSKNLIQVRHELIYRPNPFISSKNIKSLSSSTRNKKHDNQVLIKVF